MSAYGICSLQMGDGGKEGKYIFIIFSFMKDTFYIKVLFLKALLGTGRVLEIFH